MEDLRAIEHAAGQLFRGLGLIDHLLDESYPEDELLDLIERGQAWVACAGDDTPVGFILASPRGTAAYIEEMDVHPEHGRRGLGTRLMGIACAWAESRGFQEVTLSTFQSVPWNGPFYRKLGFRSIERAAWTPEMYEIREEEIEDGLPMADRVFMRLKLGDPGRHSP